MWTMWPDVGIDRLAAACADVEPLLGVWRGLDRVDVVVVRARDGSDCAPGAPRASTTISGVHGCAVPSPLPEVPRVQVHHRLDPERRTSSSLREALAPPPSSRRRTPDRDRVWPSGVDGAGSSSASPSRRSAPARPGSRLDLSASASHRGLVRRRRCASGNAGRLMCGPRLNAVPHAHIAQLGSSFSACSNERCASSRLNDHIQRQPLIEELLRLGRRRRDRRGGVAPMPSKVNVVVEDSIDVIIDAGWSSA